MMEFEQIGTKFEQDRWDDCGFLDFLFTYRSLSFMMTFTLLYR